MTLKGDVILKEKLTGILKKETRTLVTFHASSRKSKDLHFVELLLSIAYKVSAKKVYTEELSLMIQNFEENLLFI